MHKSYNYIFITSSITFNVHALNDQEDENHWMIWEITISWCHSKMYYHFYAFIRNKWFQNTQLFRLNWKCGGTFSRPKRQSCLFDNCHLIIFATEIVCFKIATNYFQSKCNGIQFAVILVFELVHFEIAPKFRIWNNCDSTMDKILTCTNHLLASQYQT